MARLTARIERLETLDGAHAGDELAHLSEAELEAQICEVAERLTNGWREQLRGGMSIAEIRAEIGRLMAELGRSPDDAVLAPLLAEVQAPSFDAKRYYVARTWPSPQDE